jgi:CRP-like cAMP-binding protein
LQIIEIHGIVEHCSDLNWISASAIEQISKLFQLELYTQREVIHQGRDRLATAHLVVSGSLQVIALNGQRHRIENIYGEGQFLGMTDLFLRQDQLLRTVVAEPHLLMLSIPMEDLQRVLSQDPESKEPYNSLLRHYDVYQFLKNGTFLGTSLPSDFLIHFANTFELRHYDSEDKVFSQGDAPDGFFICSSGKLKVEILSNGHSFVVSTLSKGDYFGELALLNEGKRSASITAIRPSDCYFLSKENFKGLVQSEVKVRQAFELLENLAYED